MWQKIAEGTGLNLGSVIGYEDEVEEGQRARLTINLRSPISTSVATDLQQQLDYRGVGEAEVSTYGSNIDITYRKGFPWLGIIVGVIIGLIALAILVVSWQFYKEAPVGFSLLALAGIVVAVATTIYIVRRGT